MTGLPTSPNLMTTTALSRPFIRPTEIERRVGRILRAPDHGASDPPADPAPPAADPAPADPADDPSLISGAHAPPADPSDPPADPADPPADPANPKPDPKDPKEPTAEGPPEKYELTAPEGMEIDDTVLSEVDPVFRELGLSNEQANKIIPLAGKLVERVTAAQLDAHNAMGADWAKEAKADPRIGGKNWAETERLVAKALDTAGQGLGKDGAKKVGEFKELLDATKLGNHPVLISMFRFYGERISEDIDFARSDAGAPVKQDRLKALYPNDVPKTE